MHVKYKYCRNYEREGARCIDQSFLDILLQQLQRGNLLLRLNSCLPLQQ